MIAYIDESLRVRDHLYVVAAGLAAPAGARELVAELRKALPGRSPRFHWRNESEETRMRMLDRIHELGLETFAVCYCEERPRWSERGRIQAIKRLLWELQQHQVVELILESRGEVNDERDRKTIFRAQRAGHASRSLSYRFATPYREPLLWVPDAVAGAVSASYADGMDKYLDRLADRRPLIVDVAD